MLYLSIYSLYLSRYMPYLTLPVRSTLSYIFMLAVLHALILFEEFLRISCKAGLVVLNFLSFCLPGRLSLHFKGYLTGYSILSLKVFFPLDILKCIIPLSPGLQGFLKNPLRVFWGVRGFPCM